MIEAHKMVVSVETIISVISKSQGIKILKALRNGEKTQKEISIETKTDKSIVNRRLREFVKVGLVKERFDHEERVLKYSLTEFGKKVLEGLDAFEGVVGEWIRDNNDDWVDGCCS